MDSRLGSARSSVRSLAKFRKEYQAISDSGGQAVNFLTLLRARS